MRSCAAVIVAPLRDDRVVAPLRDDRVVAPTKMRGRLEH
jgi:hypothetical protein